MSINRVISISNSVIARALHFVNATTQQSNRHSSDHYEHDEIHQSLKLTHGDRIEVSNISGPVEVESIDGDVAEVHLIRSAKTKAEFAWNKLRIRQIPTGFVVEPEPEPEDDPLRPRIVRVSQAVLLKLPRQAGFTAVSVSGSISIAATLDATVLISGCSGSVIMKETNGPADISGVSGSVILHVTHLSERGLRVSGTSDTVKLYLPDKLDAELFIMNHSGRVFIDIPHQELRSGHHYRLGQGGPHISVSGVTGDVIVRRS